MTSGRSVGRPRDIEKDLKIADATWNILSERGYDGLTFEAVANEAGCTRATIYRRYASKAELVVTVLQDTLASFAPDLKQHASPHEALHGLVDTAITYLTRTRAAAILHIASLARREPEVAEVLNRHIQVLEPYYIVQWRRLAPHADLEDLQFITHTLLGSVVYHLTIRPIDLSPERIDRLVASAIAMLPEEPRSDRDKPFKFP